MGTAPKLNTGLVADVKARAEFYREAPIKAFANATITESLNEVINCILMGAETRQDIISLGMKPTTVFRRMEDIMALYVGKDPGWHVCTSKMPRAKTEAKAKPEPHDTEPTMGFNVVSILGNNYVLLSEATQALVDQANMMSGAVNLIGKATVTKVAMVKTSAGKAVELIVKPENFVDVFDGINPGDTISINGGQV